MVRTDRRDDIFTDVWNDICIAHDRVMRTKTIKQFDKAQARFMKAVVNGAERLKAARDE
jgi:hypothetical protein